MKRLGYKLTDTGGQVRDVGNLIAISEKEINKLAGEMTDEQLRLAR